MEIEKKESNPDPTPSCWGSLDRDRDRIAGFARDQGDISTLRDRVTFLFCVDRGATQIGWTITKKTISGKVRIPEYSHHLLGLLRMMA